MIEWEDGEGRDAVGMSTERGRHESFMGRRGGNQERRSKNEEGSTRR